MVNRPKVAAYRAPGAPIAAFAVESVVDELAKKLGMDPIELRLKNAAKEGTKAAYGPKFGPIGLERDARSGQEAPRTGTRRCGKNQGRGVASGFWFNFGGETCGVAQRQRGRHGVADGRHARHRRLARLAVA